MFQRVKRFPSKLRSLVRALKELGPLRAAMDHVREDHARLAALYESAASRTALLEIQVQRLESSESTGRPETTRLQNDFRARSSNGEDLGTGGQMLDETASVSNSLSEKYRAVSAECARLRQQRAQLLEKVRHLARQNVHHLAFPNLGDSSAYLPVHVIDVGAQPLTSEEHVYENLIKAGACLVTGFEPLPDKPSPKHLAVRILDKVLGAGGPAVFHVASFDPTSSLLRPNLPFLRQFIALADMCKTVSEYPVQTTRLDDIRDIADCDFLKLDVQGGELEVLRGADRLLERTIVVHTEVEFAPVYIDQPLFADIDTFLRAKGFELIDLIKFGHNTYAEMPSRKSASRLLWSDAIYFRNLDSLAALGPQKLLRAAYIAHTNYGMWDFAAHILARHDRAAGSSPLEKYLAVVDR